MADRSRRSAVQRKWVSRRYSHDWSPARTHHKLPPQDCNRARLESTERIGHRECTRHMRNRLDYRYDPCPRNPRWCPVSNRGTRLDSSSYTHRIHHPIRRLGRCRSPHRKSVHWGTRTRYLHPAACTRGKGSQNIDNHLGSPTRSRTPRRGWSRRCNRVH